MEMCDFRMVDEAGDASFGVMVDEDGESANVEFQFEGNDFLCVSKPQRLPAVRYSPRIQISLSHLLDSCHSFTLRHRRDPSLDQSLFEREPEDQDRPF